MSSHRQFTAGWTELDREIYTVWYAGYDTSWVRYSRLRHYVLSCMCHRLHVYSEKEITDCLWDMANGKHVEVERVSAHDSMVRFHPSQVHGIIQHELYWWDKEPPRKEIAVQLKLF